MARLRTIVHCIARKLATGTGVVGRVLWTPGEVNRPGGSGVTNNGTALAQSNKKCGFIMVTRAMIANKFDACVV